MNAEELRAYLWTSSSKAGARPPAREVFHLPGQHDQADHGRRGAARREPGIVESAADLSLEKINELHADIRAWPPQARHIAGMALRKYQSSHYPDTELMVRRGANGRALGVMELGDSGDLIAAGDPIKSGDYLEVEYLASGKRGSGAGTALLEAAFERAAESDRGIVLYSVEEATNFYRKLGGEEVPNRYHVFFWPPNKVKSMVEQRSR